MEIKRKSGKKIDKVNLILWITLYLFFIIESLTVVDKALQIMSK